MPRTTKAKPAAKPTTSGRKPAQITPTQAKRPAGAKAVPKPTKPARAVTRAARTANSVPSISKGELRIQVEKLGQTVATLRSKSRESNRAVKAAAVRIAELEAQVAGLERQLAAPSKPGKSHATVPAPSRGRRSQNIDPGEAVPPGVAIAEPAAPDAEAEAAREALEEHLDGSDT